jgi:hypothetical protein
MIEWNVVNTYSFAGIISALVLIIIWFLWLRK